MRLANADTNILYVFSGGPYSASTGQEGLDAALLGAAFDCTVSVLFLHDGVFQLLAGQSNEGEQLKQYTKGFAALQDFGINQVYLHDLSLLARGLELENLSVEGQSINSAQITDLISKQHRVFIF